MEKILIDLGYKYLETGRVYYKEYKNCVICIDTNHHVILISTDGKNLRDIKRFSTKLEMLEKEDEDIIKDVIYAKIRFYLEEGEEL